MNPAWLYVAVAAAAGYAAFKALLAIELRDLRRNPPPQYTHREGDLPKE
jgi:hypothetical protein